MDATLLPTVVPFAVPMHALSGHKRPFADPTTVVAAAAAAAVAASADISVDAEPRTPKRMRYSPSEEAGSAASCGGNTVPTMTGGSCSTSTMMFRAPPLPQHQSPQHLPRSPLHSRARRSFGKIRKQVSLYHRRRARLMVQQENFSSAQSANNRHQVLLPHEHLRISVPSEPQRQQFLMNEMRNTFVVGRSHRRVARLARYRQLAVGTNQHQQQQQKLNGDLQIPPRFVHYYEGNENRANCITPVDGLITPKHHLFRQEHVDESLFEIALQQLAASRQSQDTMQDE